MESDLGKLFIGGISWDTNEDRLKEYFQAYGEVVETVIMKDRTTGRARGFGFVVFAEPAVAERVVSEKHTIDGRMVEAKKAVPRDDQHILNRNSANMHGSPGPAHTKKIFVGGLASTVTETDFKKYFSQFGTITDVVVMYDHNTQRPRGFGFITYDSEDAVEKVLLKTFHELNGKMVEVKRAVPKELSPGANRSPLTGYNYSVNRLNSFPNGYAQGFNLSSPGGYGVRMDGRFSPIASTRGGFTPFGPSDIGIGMNFESSLSSSSGSGTNFGSNLIYGRGVNPYYIGNSSRYANSIGYSGGNGESGSALSLTGRNVWGNSSYNLSSLAASSNAYMGSGNWSNGLLGNNGLNWGSTPSISGQVGMSKPNFDSGALGYGSGGNRYGGLGGAAYGTNNETTVAPASYSSSNSYYDGAYGNLYSGSLVHEDPTWRSSISELDEPTSFGYGIGNAASDVSARSSTGYIGGYNVTSNQSDRGVAA